jgi:hypothetical protein
MQGRGMDKVPDIPGMPHVFYVTDSKAIADRLATHFKEEPRHSCLPAAEYSVVSEDDMDEVRRTRAQRQLDKVLACVRGESGTSDIEDFFCGLSLLASDYRRAADWEPGIRRELGILPKPTAQAGPILENLREFSKALREREAVAPSPCVTPPAAVAPASCKEDAKQRKRFAVGLSFPGERRAFVQMVAEDLGRVLGRKRILYDKYHKPEFARPNLDTYLQRLYHEQSELIAVFLCADYQKKEWCGLEWRPIRDLMKKRESSAIMFFRFDEAQIDGLYGIDGYIDIQQFSAPEVAAMILERLRANEEGARD